MIPTHFHLRPWTASVDYTVDGEARRREVSYVKEPEFRTAVLELTQEVVESQQRGLFGNLCGQCGNSCRRPVILVREQEIFGLQSRLNLDERTFRDRYLEPAFTWNSGDAVLRQPGGACPFLSSNGTDEPLNARCTVYEDRPQSCREFRSDASFCRKDVGVIMQELGSLCVHPQTMHAALKDGTSVSLPTDPARWERLCEAFQSTSDHEPAAIPEPDQPGPAPPSAPRPEGLEWLILGETAIAVKLAGQDSIPLSLEATIAEARGLLASILQRPEDDLQKYVGSPDPDCLICGECCRAFELEIMPFDVHRLARALRCTYQHFLEHRSTPGRYSWNPHNRIMNKRSVPRHSKRLAELRVLDQSSEDCQFLERRDNGYYICSVYEDRPEMCRIFPPTHDLCRKTNAVQNWGRQAQNLRSVLLTADTLFVQATNQEAPQSYPRHRWPEVDAAARALEEAVLGSLACAAKAESE